MRFLYVILAHIVLGPPYTSRYLSIHVDCHLVGCKHRILGETCFGLLEHLRAKVFVECVICFDELKEASSFHTTPLTPDASPNTKTLKRPYIESSWHFDTLDFQNPRTWCLWKCHMTCIMSQMPFSWIQGRPAWFGLWRQLMPTTCIHKVLVACASDYEGRHLFISRMLCSSLLLQTLLIPIKM